MVRLDPTAKLSFTSAHEKIISSVSGSVFLNWQIFVYVSYLVGIYVKCAWAQCRKFLFSPGRASGGRELRPNRLCAGKAVGLLYYCRKKKNHTEAKAKVVAAGRGTEVFQLNAALEI